MATGACRAMAMWRRFMAALCLARAGNRPRGADWRGLGRRLATGAHVRTGPASREHFDHGHDLPALALRQRCDGFPKRRGVVLSLHCKVVDVPLVPRCLLRSSGARAFLRGFLRW